MSAIDELWDFAQSEQTLDSLNNFEKQLNMLSSFVQAKIINIKNNPKRIRDEIYSGTN